MTYLNQFLRHAKALTRRLPSASMSSPLDLVRSLSSSRAAFSHIQIDVSPSGTGRLLVPLPSSGEVSFTLVPALTVGHLIRDLQSEDKAIQAAKVLQPSGASFASSTPIAELLRQPFRLVINEDAYDIDGSDIAPYTSEKTASENELLAQRLAHSVQLLEEEHHRRHSLREMIIQAKLELEPMEELRRQCETRARRSAQVGVWSSLVFMSFSWGFLARLTWWEYSWDLMEPVTYFIGFGTQIGLFGYYMLTSREHTYETQQERAELRSFYKAAQKKGMDIERYNKLRRRISGWEEELYQS